MPCQIEGQIGTCGAEGDQQPAPEEPASPLAPLALASIPLCPDNCEREHIQARPVEPPPLQEGPLAPASSLAARAQHTQGDNSIWGLKLSGLVGLTLNEGDGQSPLGLSTSWALAICRSFWELPECASLLQTIGVLWPSVGSPWSDSCSPEKANPQAEVPVALGGFVLLCRGGARRRKRILDCPSAARAAEGGLALERSERAGVWVDPGKQRREGDTGALGLPRDGGHGGLLCPRGRDGLTLAKVKPELSLACPALWVYLQLTLGCSLALAQNQS